MRSTSRRNPISAFPGIRIHYFPERLFTCPGFRTLLRESGIRFCVIGGQAVNAYVEPLVSLDLDLAVAVTQIDQVRKLAKDRFRAEEFPTSLNISAPGSNLRVQIQTDPRYGDFVERASMRDVLG